MGVPAGFDEAATTHPYYRSSYVFITRRDRNLHIASLDDPRLRALKIGVHVLGEQDDSLPPVHALISRGIVHNLVGFSIFGTLYEKNPPADLIKAVEDNEVDVAIAWGPLAGYFSRTLSPRLDITPLLEDPANPQLPFHFDIGIGVRETDTALKTKLDAELARRHKQIEEILQQFGIPQLPNTNQIARSSED
jgi:mxaJ protein